MTNTNYLIILCVCAIVCDGADKLESSPDLKPINSSEALKLFTSFSAGFGVPLPKNHPLKTTKWQYDPADYTDKWTSLPMPQNVYDCETRPRTYQFGNHSYFYSKMNALHSVRDHYGARLPNNNWWQAFETCRKYCMSPVSIETEDEWRMVERLISELKVQFTWTSGRRCTYDWCRNLVTNDSRGYQMEPNIYNGWVWMGSGKRLSPANYPPVNPNGSVWKENPWLERGENEDIAQPDNAERHYNSSHQPELCLGLIYRTYKVNRVGWHDIACHHPKYVLCEDDDELLAQVKLSHADVPQK